MPNQEKDDIYFPPEPEGATGDLGQQSPTSLTNWLRNQPVPTGPLRDQYDLMAGDGNPTTVNAFRKGARSAYANKYLTQFMDMMPGPIDTVEAIGNRGRVQNQVVADLEAAWLVGQQFGIPLGWLVKQYPEDLPLLANANVAAQLAMDTDYMANATLIAAERREQISVRRDEILANGQKWSNFWYGVSGGFADPLIDALMGTGPVWGEEATDQGPAGPSLYEQEQALIQAEQEILALPAPMADPGFNFWDTGDIGETAMDFFSTGLQSLQTLMEGAVAVSLPGIELMWGANTPLPQVRAFHMVTDNRFTPIAVANQIWNDQQEVERAGITEVLDAAEGNEIRQARELHGDATTDYLMSTDSPMIQDIKLMSMGIGGNFDPAVFRGLVEEYVNLLYDDSPEAQTQALAVVNEFNQDQQDMLMALEERNFSLDGAASSLISWYGVNVPLRLATYFSVAMTDEDIFSVFSSEGWQRIHQEAVRSDLTPSKALGLDGTFQGILVDLFGGIAFDPTTFLFGPRALGGLSHVNQVSRAARTPVFRKLTEQMIDSFRSPTRSEAAMISIAEDLGTYGLYDEAVSASMGVSGVETGPRKWLDGDMGVFAREAPTERILAMLPEDLVARARVRVAAGEGRTTHFNDVEAVVIYDPISRGVTMSEDDVVRLLVGQERNVGAAPFRGQVYEPPLPPERMAVIGAVARGEGDFLFHGTGLRATALDDIMAGRSEISGGFSHSTERSAGYAPATVAEGAAEVADTAARKLQVEKFYGRDAFDESGMDFKTVDEGWEALQNEIAEQGGGGDVVVEIGPHVGENMQLVYNRDDVIAILPPEGRAWVAEGRDIERLYPAGPASDHIELGHGEFIAEGPVPRPVGSFTPAEMATIREGFPAFRPLSPDGLTPLADDAVGGFALNDLFKEEVLYPYMREVMPAVTAIMKRLLAMGGGNMYPMKTLMAQTFAGDFRAFLERRGKDFGVGVTKYFTRQNISLWARVEGFGWEHDARNTIIRMLAHDKPQMDLWLRRFREVMQGGDNATIVAMQAKVKALRDELMALSDRSKGALMGVDDVPVIPVTAVDDAAAEAAKLESDIEAAASGRTLREADDAERGVIPRAEPHAVDTATRASEGERAILVRAEAALASKVAKEERALAVAMAKHQRDVSANAAKFYNDMWNDFNRRYIGTNPVWKKFAGPDGFVPWEKIIGGDLRPVATELGVKVPEELADALKGEGFAANKVIKNLIDPGNVHGVQLPLSVVDMIAASTLDGAGWMRWRQNVLASHVAKTANMLDRWWKIDKVFRFSTSLAVSFDEVLRIFHSYGWRAVSQYLEDHAMFVSAHIKAGRLNNRAGLAPHSPKRGGLGDITDPGRVTFSHIDRWNKRMQRLEEYPDFYRRMENEYMEKFSDTWSDLEFGDPDWLPAMQQWTGNLLEHRGFRASLRGPDEFRVWWESEEAAELRTSTAFDWGGGKTRLPTMEEAMNGYNFLSETLLLNKVRPGRTEHVRQAVRDAARRLDAGEVQVILPENVLREIQLPVRGVRNEMPRTQIGRRINNAAMDRMFSVPTDYRRGFIAELARAAETKRLRSLYNSQGMKIIPDWQIGVMAEELGLRGVSPHFGFGESIEQLLMKRNIVTEGTIARFAERRAMAETENIMYSWHMTSRAGRSAMNRAAFPFGKPWFDMMAYYSRELLTRPALRGYLNNANFAGIGAIANKAVDYGLPINPKPAAMISRIAATDFNAERGFGGEGALGVGLDFSPMLFLPKAGASAFQAIFPGLGMIPMWLGDYLISHIYDPFEQPEEYQRLTEQFAQWIPSFGYQQVGIAARTLGGGTIGTVVKGIADSYMIGTSNDWHEPLAMLGDIQAEIQAVRAMKGLLADPQELEDLMNMSEEELSGAYQALIGEAASRGAKPHIGELATRFLLPIKPDWDTTDDEVEDVWLQAGVQFPQLQGFRYDPDVTDEQKAAQANDIRSAFFDLPQIDRQRMIVQYPQIAVNLISGWEWTKKAVLDFPAEAGLPYRSSSTGEGIRTEQARHNSYIRNDYIRPISGTDILHRIIGTIFDARLAVTQDMFTQQAELINENIWSNIPARGQNYFQQLVDEGIVDATDARDVWRRWGTLEPIIEGAIGPQTLPEKFKPWGTSWGGLEDEGFRQSFRDLNMNRYAPEVVESANILGIDLEVDITGEQFLNLLFNEINESSTGSPLASYSRSEYDTWQNTRNTAFSSTRNELARTATGNLVSPEYQQQMRDFLDYDKRTGVLRNLDGSIDITRSNEVREQYTQMMNANPEIDVSWENVWAEGFAGTYGSLDWTVPEPPQLDPSEFVTQWRPYVQAVVDGDTLVVSREETASVFNLPGTSFDVGAPGTTPQTSYVRLLGVMAPEMSTEDGEKWKTQLLDAIMAGREAGLAITLVRDVNTTGSNTDYYGRELAWLFIGDKPYYYPDTITPGD